MRSLWCAHFEGFLGGRRARTEGNSTSSTLSLTGNTGNPSGNSSEHDLPVWPGLSPRNPGQPAQSEPLLRGKCCCGGTFPTCRPESGEASGGFTGVSRLNPGHPTVNCLETGAVAESRPLRMRGGCCGAVFVRVGHSRHAMSHSVRYLRSSPGPDDGSASGHRPTAQPVEMA